MSNSVFPTLLGKTWNITRAPIFATKIQQAVGGTRVATAFQPYPIWKWSIAHSFLRTYTPPGGSAYTEWQTLVDFFNSRKGAFDTWLYDDTEDDSVTAQVIGIGNGSNRNFQMGRTLLSGGFFEPLYNFNVSVNPLNIYLNGALQSSGYALTNNSTGILNFTTAPGSGVVVTWTGNYYWRCVFDGDTTEFGMFAQHFWENKKLTFYSVLGA